jgi:hypothetical protein
MIEEYPTLFQLLGGQLNQDWTDEYASPDEAIQAFIDEWPVESKDAARRELDDFIDRIRGIPNPARALFELSCCYDPTVDGWSVVSWLEHVRAKLAGTGTPPHGEPTTG